MARPGALLAVCAALVGSLLAGCGADGRSAAPVAPTASVFEAPVSAAPVSEAPTPTPAAPDQGSKGGVVLGGEDLGVTRLGQPFREAVAAVSEVLGEPDADPAETVSCIEADVEVRWGDLVLASQDDRLAGWASRSTTLQTPSGVTVGTPLPELDRVHGSSLERFPANPDNPPTFSVDGVDLSGELSSEQDDATVTRLFSSFCAGP
jgi:hypothetical protein